MNTNTTIRFQLFEYYSNTELFAHLCMVPIKKTHFLEYSLNVNVGKWLFEYNKREKWVSDNSHPSPTSRMAIGYDLCMTSVIQLSWRPFWRLLAIEFDTMVEFWHDGRILHDGRIWHLMAKIWHDDQPTCGQLTWLPFRCLPFSGSPIVGLWYALLYLLYSNKR